jgi:hypothetical protein
MVEAYVILGEHDVRKSSSVRALTGAGSRGQRTVATNVGNIDVWTEIRALQENSITSAKFITTVINSGDQYTLFPLRISQHRGFHGGANYIQDFINAGWTILHVVLLGAAAVQGGLPPGTPNPNIVPQSRVTPANQIAAQIRAWWAWQ